MMMLDRDGALVRHNRWPSRSRWAHRRLARLHAFVVAEG